MLISSGGSCSGVSSYARGISLALSGRSQEWNRNAGPVRRIFCNQRGTGNAIFFNFFAMARSWLIV